jgi:hypothetical protein
MIDTNSELHRHRCEVRWCLSRGREAFDAYKVKVAEKRGERAAERLIRDVNSQAAAGNRGKWGDWR